MNRKPSNEEAMDDLFAPFQHLRPAEPPADLLDRILTRAEGLRPVRTTWIWAAAALWLLLALAEFRLTRQSGQEHHGQSFFTENMLYNE
jgi:hypothetical protein